MPKPLDWEEWLYGFAAHAALKSKDPTQVGAALVGPAREVRLTSFNGPPRGVNDLPERLERPTKYFYASHAETNLIAFAAREGIATRGCAVYVTHFPCAACMRTMIQAGVKTVIYGPGETRMLSLASEAVAEREAVWCMAFEAGVELIRTKG